MTAPTPEEIEAVTSALRKLREDSDRAGFLAPPSDEEVAIAAIQALRSLAPGEDVAGLTDLIDRAFSEYDGHSTIATAIAKRICRELLVGKGDDFSC